MRPHYRKLPEGTTTPREGAEHARAVLRELHFLAVSRGDEVTRRGSGVATTAFAAACLATLACGGGASAPPPGKIPITTSSNRALREYLKGRDLEEKLRKTDAREYYARAAELDPSFALAQLGLASTAPTNSQFFEALRRAVELAPRVSEWERHLILALDAGVNSRPDEQLEHLKALVSEYPNDERAHGLLGNLLMGRQEWKAAIEQYRRAIEINPDYSPPYNQLGYALRNLGEYAEAAKAFDTYTKLIPDEPNPYDSYAELLMKMGRFAESIEKYKKALEINPNFAPSYLGMANDYIFLGKGNEARACLTKLRFIARNDGERRTAELWTAASYLFEGDSDHALEQVAKASEIASQTGDRLSVANDLVFTGDILLDAGRIDEAQTAFNQAFAMLERADATPEVKAAGKRTQLYESARIDIARKDLDAAENASERYSAAVRAIGNPYEVRRAHELAGLVAMAKGDAARAVRELEQANQEDPRVLFDLSQAYAAAGNTQAAKRTLKAAADFNGIELSYAFVRAKALALLTQQE